MFSLDIELLTGRYIACSYNDRRRAEWPPHPARLFSALVATLHEHEGLTQHTRDALRWLETQPPPQVVAGPANARCISNVFVPVNDTYVTSGWEASFERLTDGEVALARADSPKDLSRAEKRLTKLRAKLENAIAKSVQDDGKRAKSPVERAKQALPDQRNRQPRTFPCVVPDTPRISFVWPESELPDKHRRPLSVLAARLVRLGHSSCFVACSVGNGELAQQRVQETWHPAEAGEETLRVVTPGQLERLERAYGRHKGVQPRQLPCAFANYAVGEAVSRAAPLHHSVFDPACIVIRVLARDAGRRSPKLALTRGPDLSRAMRGALLRHAEDDPPAELSGHAPDGSPLAAPHVAFVPLADVGSQWASGAILGVGIVLPRELSADARNRVLSAIGRWERANEGPCRLVMGRLGALAVERIIDLDRRSTLQPSTWNAPSERWASVTAVALDRNPGDLRSRDPEKAAAAAAKAEEIVARACTRIGLPEPAWVQVMRRSLFDAAPKAEAFMPFPRRAGATRRLCVHVEIGFSHPVAGPILLGAGRYVGLGVCRPAPSGRSQEDRS